MESWLSPFVGFDVANRAARIYGTGQSPISWVSCSDVAEICMLAYSSPETEGKTIAFGGPHSLTALEVVNIFQKRTNDQWKLEYLPAEFLLAQFQGATDPMQKTFGALMLGAAYGDDIPVDPIVQRLGIHLTSVE
jgi:nucleoside-diphosphate-sugar epimerase